MERDADTINARLVLDTNDDVPIYYINYIEVIARATEVTLLCARIPGKPSREQVAEMEETKEIVIMPELQILIAPSVAEGLIVALSDQVDKYKEFSVRGQE